MYMYIHIHIIQGKASSTSGANTNCEGKDSSSLKNQTKMYTHTYYPGQGWNTSDLQASRKKVGRSLNKIKYYPGQGEGRRRGREEGGVRDLNPTTRSERGMGL